MESTKLHSASTVPNIKSLIPITLEMETGQYASWSELFKIQCRTFLVIDHLSPKPPAPAASSSKDTDKDKDKVTTPVDDQWDRLDAIVLQWIYATISNDLLHTILKPNTTAYDAWTTLEGIFQDNKSSRAIHLLHKFSNTRLDGFPNVSAYCQQLKMIADQLANVGSPVENDRLVLQLISGLNEQYEGIATILQQQDPLPTFYEARSKLVLVESRKAEQALNMAQTAGTALNGNTSRPSNQTHSDAERGRGRGRSRGRGRGRQANRGRGAFGSSGNPTSAPGQGWPPNTWAGNQQWAANNNFNNNWAANQQWAAPPQWNSWAAPPPCPYPTTSPRPSTNTSGQGILGSRPNQAHYTAYTHTHRH
ncbi:putative RNA-directed DNA polymerase [Helianthus debilis subsp. tardiflorus]